MIPHLQKHLPHVDDAQLAVPVKSHSCLAAISSFARLSFAAWKARMSRTKARATAGGKSIGFFLY